MIAQLDLFAGNQLDLLAPPVPAAAPVAPRRFTSMPRDVEAAWERAYSLEVRQAFLEAAMARPGEWLRSSDFRAVTEGYNIGSCHGHALSAMARAGMLEEKKHYYGSDHPAKGNYQGFNVLFRFRFPMSGVAHA